MVDLLRLRSDGLDAPTRRALLDLWTAAFTDFTDDDAAHAFGGTHILALGEDGVPVAHASVVPRRLTVGGRPVATGYVEAVATAPSYQRRGLGSAVVRAAGEVVTAYFEMGALSTGAHAFYERLGWRRWRGPTYVLTTSGPVRTEDEDDGVMVLGDDVDVTQPIACPNRTGDAW